MDVNETILELTLAQRRGDDREAKQHAEDLRRWLEKGGPLPDGFTLPDCMELINRELDPYGDHRDGFR